MELRFSSTCTQLLVYRGNYIYDNVQAYGVHVNGYVRSSSPPVAASETSPSGMYMWIGRRSKTKQTFPGKLDHVAAGSLMRGESSRSHWRQHRLLSFLNFNIRAYTRTCSVLLVTLIVVKITFC